MNQKAPRHSSSQRLADAVVAPLDRDNATPIFAQIRDRLKGAIADGTLRAHDRLPSERLLGEQFDVSRMTVRQALDKLIHEGLLYTLPANGTFVAEHRIELPLTRLTSFTEDMESRGMRASSSVLGHEVQTASFEVAQILRLPPGARCFELVRLRFADDEPLAIERVWIPAAYAPELDAHDFANESLYEVLRRDYEMMLATAHQTIEAALPTPEEQEALNITPLTPVLRIFRLTTDQSDRVVEYVRATYRGDRYQLSVDLR